jgi:hypothetical protein
MTAGARVPVKDRTQPGRHRVDQPTIRGRTCANLGDYKPLFACVDRTFSNQFIANAHHDPARQANDLIGRRIQDAMTAPAKRIGLGTTP